MQKGIKLLKAAGTINFIFAIISTLFVGGEFGSNEEESPAEFFERVDVLWFILGLLITIALYVLGILLLWKNEELKWQRVYRAIGAIILISLLVLFGGFAFGLAFYFIFALPIFAIFLIAPILMMVGGDMCVNAWAEIKKAKQEVANPANCESDKDK